MSLNSTPDRIKKSLNLCTDYCSRLARQNQIGIKRLSSNLNLETIIKATKSQVELEAESTSFNRMRD